MHGGTSLQDKRHGVGTGETPSWGGAVLTDQHGDMLTHMQHRTRVLGVGLYHRALVFLREFVQRLHGLGLSHGGGGLARGPLAGG